MHPNKASKVKVLQNYAWVSSTGIARILDCNFLANR